MYLQENEGGCASLSREVRRPFDATPPTSARPLSTAATAAHPRRQGPLSPRSPLTSGTAESPSVSRVRRRRRDMQILSSDLAAYVGLEGAEIEFPDPSPGPQGVLIRELFWGDAMRALNRLPPLEEAVFALRCLQDRSTHEVAGMLGRTEDSVASALKRARRQLQLVLERQGSDLMGLSWLLQTGR